jgi:osmotically-inducible protein OsmY
MRSDQEIKQDVERELRYDPDMDATDIAVAVKDGVVTLTGFVHSYGDKWEAEREAKKVIGVRAVANDIEVRLPAVDVRDDHEIARDVAREIKLFLPLAADDIKATVRSGWVTLEGQVEWNFQSQRAEQAVRRVRGVKGVSNLITVKPKVEPGEVRRQIEEALKRNAEVDARNVTAWRAPGVRRVDNQIIVDALVAA